MSCMKPCATARSLPGCTGRPPSSHKAWGSACVWLSRLWDEKRKAPVYPGERLPLTNAPNARILLTILFRWGKTMPDRSFTTANYYYFGYYFTGNGSVCCGTVQDAK